MRRAVLILGVVVALAATVLWMTGAFAQVQPWLLDQQREVQNRLAGAVRAMRGGQPGAWAALMAVCFGYGVLHAAGPGHGKLLIGGYAVAQRVRLLPLAGIALLASLAQAAVAVALVGAGVLALGWTRAQMEEITVQVMAPVGTAAIALVGLWLMLRGIRAMRAENRKLHDHHHDHHHDHASGETCNHAHGPTLNDMEGLTSWRDAAILIAGIALRPCSGALLLLILCFGLGIGAAGVAGTVAMGLGTACVTVAVAALAVWAREGTFASLPGAGVGSRMAAAILMVQALAGAGIAVVALMLLSQNL